MITIYTITNIKNGKHFIGGTSKTLKEKMKRHRENVGGKLYDVLQDADENDFEISSIGECEDSQIKNAISECVLSFDSVENGYNDKSDIVVKGEPSGMTVFDNPASTPVEPEEIDDPEDIEDEDSE